MKMLRFTELQREDWYRLVQYLYIGLFVFSALLIVRGIYNEYTPHLDYKNSHISCANDKTYSVGDNGLLLSNGTLAGLEDYRARRLCMSDSEIGQAARKYKFAGNEKSYSDEQLGHLIRNGDKPIYGYIYNAITPAQKNYEITVEYTHRNWMGIIGWSLLYILVIAAIFESVRRIFYYLVLNTFTPEKSLFLKRKLVRRTKHALGKLQTG